MRRNPPYHRLVKDWLQIYYRDPTRFLGLDVRLFIGRDAWRCAQRYNRAGVDIALDGDTNEFDGDIQQIPGLAPIGYAWIIRPAAFALCLPPDSSPSDFNWRVLRRVNDVTVIGNADTQTIERLALELLEAGVQRVMYFSRDYSDFARFVNDEQETLCTDEREKLKAA